MQAMKAIIVVAVMLTSMFFRCGVSASTAAMAAATNTNHSVGGASGWDLSSNLRAWATRTAFRVGDSLVFRYTPVHDVMEVRKTDYDLCHTVDPLEMHNDGETVIPLREAGNRYFICGRLGHCAMGLKLHVLVLPALQMSTNVNATSPSSPLITSPPPNATSPISNNNSSRHGPDDQVVGNDHVQPSPSPLPSASSYSINSTDDAPPDHATGNTTTDDAHLTSDSPRILPLVTVIRQILMLAIFLFPSWIAAWPASIAPFVPFTHAALILLVAIITVVAVELLLTTRPTSDNNSRHGPDYVLPSPPPAASNYSIHSTDDAPLDHATGNTTTSDAQLTAKIPWIRPLVRVVAVLMIAHIFMYPLLHLLVGSPPP
ncbi:uclacyanin 1-like [Pyrus communis]|uniref:uclacyanin 1-like n=1 Tax=Pyrus communis TaxID=23211 RepID=UPI0035BFE41F